MGTDGTLYGTTANGGSFNYGVAFSLKPTAKGKYKYEKLHDFCSQANCADGLAPISHMTYAGASTGAFYNGKSPLFGITSGNTGTIFELRKGKPWTETTLYTFCVADQNCPDGAFPIELSSDPTGKSLTGVTYGGGPIVDNHSYGVIFDLAFKKKAWREKVLHAFCDAAPCVNGGYPQSFILASDGSTYGTTVVGGDANQGVAFRYEPKANNFTRLYSFCAQPNCTDGADPIGIELDSSNNVLVTTALGGNPDVPVGVLARISSGSEETLYTFCSMDACLDGAEPMAGPTVAPDNSVFGTTVAGGSAQFGTVFVFKP